MTTETKRSLSLRTLIKPNYIKFKRRGPDYTCLLKFCSCPHFVEMAMTMGMVSDKCACKHLLAIRLATAMNSVQDVTVSDEVFVESLTEVFRK